MSISEGSDKKAVKVEKEENLVKARYTGESSESVIIARNIIEARLDMSTSILASIEKLKGRENYASWKFSIENYLALEDLSNCLNGTESDQKKCARAKAAISLSIDRTVFVHIKSAATAAEIWANLTKTFEDKCAARQVTLMRKIMSTKLETSESMEVYVSDIMSTAQTLNDLGFTVTDASLAVFLLCGLPEEYTPFIMALEGMGQSLSSDVIKTKLLQDMSSSSNDEKALLVKNRSRFHKKTTITCYSCKQKGHKSFECPEKKRANSSNKVPNSKDRSKALFAFGARFLSGKFDANSWYIDSGATRHMTMHEDWITGHRKYGNTNIRAANNEVMNVSCSGDVNFNVKLNGKICEVQMKEVLCVPRLTTNLLSVSEITNKGNTVIFYPDKCLIRDMHKNVVATASVVDGLYKLDSDLNAALVAIGAKNTMELWHRRCAHVNLNDLKTMKNGGVTGMSFVDDTDEISCVACCKGKQSRKSFPKGGSRATTLIETIHGDIAGKMECNSIGGSKYCLVLVDDFSRRTFVYMLKSKSEVFDRFCSFKSFVEKQTGLKIKRFRSDNGTEFSSHKFRMFFDRHGIEHQTSIPYTPQQNGLAERTIRTITEKARCMLQDANLGKRYWAEALHTATYIKNRLTSPILSNKSPMEIWTGLKPDISHFRVFGSKAMAFVPKEKRHKFDAKSKEYIFIGYSETQKGYRLIDAKTNAVITCRDVQVIEHDNEFLKNNVHNKSFEFILDIDTDSTEDFVRENSIKQPCERNDNESTTLVDQNNTIQLDESVEEPVNTLNVGANDCVRDSASASAQNSAEEQLRRSERDMKPTQRYQAGFLTNNNEPMKNEPSNVIEAMESDEKEQWTVAMNDEYNSLIKNNTWELVDLPKGSKAIGCKWVFKRKFHENCARLKARLVARGYSQREGIDFNLTFSPVVRYTSIRFLMAMAVKFGWKIDQMDVVTAFLHGDISETIYMHQPEVFDDGSGRVCKLNKSLYGLKQASRQWNVKLNCVLETAGFVRCKKDSCVYVRRNEKSLVVIAVYVDDLLLFYNNDKWKDELKSTLKQNFHMKDLGAATNVLGIRINYNREAGTLSLDQQSYIEDILRKFNMFHCDPVKLPSDPNQKLTKDMAENKIDSNVPYQEAVGCVLYLAQCTRPDISFSVANVSQFNQQHGQAHWTAVKRILRYLKGTLHYKLTYARDTKFDELCGYTDADWASSFVDLKSCTGYAFLWQGAAISWATKKQPTVALSTAESEYMSLSAATQEALWLSQLKKEILGGDWLPLEIFCDNKGAVDLTETGTFSLRTKHISIKHHFIRDCIVKHKIKVTKISTDLMVADNLTKAVAIQKHSFCLKEMGLNTFL